jgi:hypothetical protein
MGGGRMVGGPQSSSPQPSPPQSSPAALPAGGALCFTGPEPPDASEAELLFAWTAVEQVEVPTPAGRAATRSATLSPHPSPQSLPQPSVLELAVVA